MTYDLLSGVRIVESSAFIAAPLGGVTLSQLGADVIRVDNIEGGIDYRRLPMMPDGGRSLYWTSLNRGKRSLAVDMKSPEGRELIADLVTAPDELGGVLLTNVGARWLSHATLTERREDVITCTIEGNFDGTTAVDYTVNCATGYPTVTGGGSLERPVNHVLPAWDVACALQASTSILSAILRRSRTGQGAGMRIALSDVAFSTLSSLGLLAEADLFGQDREPLGNDIYGAFGRDFTTRDGEVVMVAAISAKQWSMLVKACGIAEPIAAIEAALDMNFADEKDRFEGRDLIAALVKRWFEARDYETVRTAFDAQGVAYGRYGTVTDLLARDRRVSAENPMIEKVTTPGVGTHITTGAPVRMVDGERRQTTPAPFLGADTDRILSDVLGLPDHAIGDLHDRAIVAGPDKDPFNAGAT